MTTSSADVLIGLFSSSAPVEFAITPGKLLVDHFLVGRQAVFLVFVLTKKQICIHQGDY